MAHRHRNAAAAARRSNRPQGRAALPKPDRAPLQCTAGAGSRRVAAPQAGDRHHLGRLPHAGAEAAARRRRIGACGCCLDPPRRTRGGSRCRRARAAHCGAGGQTGWLNPFAFVRAVRAFYDGIIVLAGGISDGYALRAAEVLGCDLGYMGTKFIATHESMADDRYKRLLVESSADDILLTTAFTGLQTSMLKPSIVAAGLDPDDLPARGAIDIGKDIDVTARENRPKRWRDIWSGGHSTSGVTDVLAVDDLVASTLAEYREAVER